MDKAEIAKSLKRIGMLVAFMAAGILALQGGYLVENVRFMMSGPTVATSAGSVAEATDVAASIPNVLSVPSLGIDAPVIEPAGATERDYQAALKDGVAHYPGTANAGEAGNVYIFGHSSDYPWSDGRYKTVFALLPRITEGASVFLTDGEGKRFEYRVTGTAIVSPGEKWVLDQHDGKVSMLTLQTSYPLGTALRRFVVFADLVED